MTVQLGMAGMHHGSSALISIRRGPLLPCHQINEDPTASACNADCASRITDSLTADLPAPLPPWRVAEVFRGPASCLAIREDMNSQFDIPQHNPISVPDDPGPAGFEPFAADKSTVEAVQVL